MLVCRYSSLTLSHQRIRGGEQRQPDKGGKGRNSLPLPQRRRRKGGRQRWGRGVLLSGFCLSPTRALSPARLCFQMEGTQRDGELEHVEGPGPLTDKEKVMIQDSWAKVFQSCDDAGVAILVRYSSLSLSSFRLANSSCAHSKVKRSSTLIFITLLIILLLFLFFF